MGEVRTFVGDDAVELVANVDGDGTPVVLLHGFPDSGALWRHVVPRLTVQGYRTIALDQRGFGRSAAPRGRKRYRMHHLAADVLAVLDALGVAKAHVVGHDWGAIVGWHLAAEHPDRVRTLAALSVGHRAAFLAGGLRQLAKSWYVAVALVPFVAERLIRARRWWLLRRLARHGATDEARWIADLSRPGRATAALDWYRANVPAPGSRAPVSTPVLGVYGDRDVALTEAQMTASAGFVRGPWRYVRLDGVGHWMPLEAPDALTAALLGFWREADAI